MRRILVGLKRVIDHSVRILVRDDGRGVVTDGVKMSLNPFCEIALEEAIRLREQGHADEVLAVSVGPPDVEQQLRTAIAMGADRALRIESELDSEPLLIAGALLALIIDHEQPMLVILGKQAIDTDDNQTGQMLAALWNRPQATFASKIEMLGGAVRVAREIDEGIEILELDLPAVVTSDLRLNEPRYVKLPQLLRAKKQVIETRSLEDLGVEFRPQYRIDRVTPPPARPPGVRVDSVNALVAELEARGLL